MPDLGEAKPAPQLTMTAVDVEALAEDFVSYFTQFSPRFRRKEQAKWALKYMQGLLLPLPHKSVQAIAMAVEGGNIRNMQQMLGAGKWDDDKLLLQLWSLVQDQLAEEDGVFIVDGSGFPKKGVHSVGVARQWCGNTGKVDNCQVGVFVGYTATNGSLLLDRRLFMPQRWFTEDYDQRRLKNEVPEERQHQTAGQLALQMLQNLCQHGLSGRWVTADEEFGKSPPFLDGVDDLGLQYFAEVAVNTHVWQTRPETYVKPWSGRGRPTKQIYLKPGESKPIPVSKLAAGLPESRFVRLKFREGSKGPQVADFAQLRVVATRNHLPGPDVWLVLKRSLDGEMKYFLSNASAETVLSDHAKVSGLRWPIESCFEECKQLVGMSDYEARTWRGWHHHMTLSILAHAFLVLNRSKKGV